MELSAHPVWTLWKFLRWFSARMVPLPRRLLWAADRIGLLAQAGVEQWRSA